MKKVLVTGATGFIGNYIIDELLKHNYSVIASSSNIESASTQKWFDQVTFKTLDLRNIDNNVNYFEFFDQPDAMIHLAWEGLPNYKGEFHIIENLPRHLMFLSNLIEHGLNNLTVTGTCLEYGMQQGCLNENMECFPSNPYAIAKNELRKSLESLNKIKKFNFKWVRLFYMYGRGQNSNSLISQLEKAIDNKEPVFNMSGGAQVRDFLPVEKVAGNLVKIVLQNNVSGIINCCSGLPITIKDFVAQYLIKINKSINLNFGFYNYTDYEPMEFWGDIKKLKSIK